VWKGERILPEGWVKYSTTPTPNNAPNQAYGAHFWLNAANPKPWLDFIPEDMYLAHGYEGQVVMIIPSRNLVIVRLGLARGPSPEMYLAFVKDVLDVLPDNKIQDSRFKI
jgi:CubicO group peptidase (beta-lactamase class C family)